jgi:hypothetical protein
LLHWIGSEFEQAGVPEDRFDEGAEAVLEQGAALFGQERERIAREFVQTLADGGVTEIPPEQLREIEGLIDAQAATDATIRALGEWIRSLDPGSAVPRNYSVTNRLFRDGPLPSTVQALREAGFAPEEIVPRSPSEAVLLNDTRRRAQPAGSSRVDYRKGGSVTARLFGSEL